MALVKCEECGKEISNKAKECPNCGYDQRSWWGRKHIITKIYLTFFALIIIVGMFGGSKTPTQTTTTVSTTKTSELGVSDISYYKLEALFGMDSRLTDLQKDEEWKKYEGKVVRWKGIVVDVDKDYFSGYTVRFKNKPATITWDVTVDFDENLKDKLITLKKGDYVTYTAKLKDKWSIGTLFLEGIDIEG